MQMGFYVLESDGHSKPKNKKMINTQPQTYAPLNISYAVSLQIHSTARVGTESTLYGNTFLWFLWL